MKNNKYLILRVKEHGKKNQTADCNRGGTSRSSCSHCIAPLNIKGLPQSITLKDMVTLSKQQSGLITFSYSKPKKETVSAQAIIDEVCNGK